HHRTSETSYTETDTLGFHDARPGPVDPTEPHAGTTAQRCDRDTQLGALSRWSAQLRQAGSGHCAHPPMYWHRPVPPGLEYRRGNADERWSKGQLYDRVAESVRHATGHPR